MKRLQPILIACSIFTSCQLNAQISITSADMPVIGDVVVQYVDTMFGVDQDAGNPGPNQTWDYSGSLNHVTINTAFVSVASTPYAADYPGSNIASTTDSVVYLFMNSQPSFVEIDGLAGPIVTAADITHMNPTQTLYQCPFTYLSNFTDDYLIDYQGDGSSFGVFAFRYVSHGNIYDSTDGFGTLKTPMGTYDALRIKRWDNATDSIFIKYVSAMEPWSLFQSYTNNQLSYKWMANGIKLPVAEVATNSSGMPTTLTYSAAVGTFGIESANLPAIKVGPNPATETVSIFVPKSYIDVNLQFEILDLNGKVLLNRNIQNIEQLNVDISFLTAGVYFYNIHFNNEKVCGKIVKQ